MKVCATSYCRTSFTEDKVLKYAPASDIARRCNVGNQTKVCGSSIIHSKNSWKLILSGINA